MRNLLVVAALAVAMMIGAATPSQAVSIGFAPANQTVNNGAAVSVDLVIAGLGVAGALGLGAFDLEILLPNPGYRVVWKLLAGPMARRGRDRVR
jgi:hypothetical protein